MKDDQSLLSFVGKADWLLGLIYVILKILKGNAPCKCVAKSKTRDINIISETDVNHLCWHWHIYVSVHKYNIVV